MTKSKTKSKKRYTKPRITAQGRVDEITLQHNTDYGPRSAYLSYWHSVQHIS